MTRSVEEFAERYDQWADEYDDDYAGDEDGCEQYRTCVSLVVEHASPRPEDTVLDLGTGTGAVALELAGAAGLVVGRDPSEGMLEQAREKAARRGIENVSFERGRFRDPNVKAVDVVVSNWALHHLAPDAQRDAIETIAGLDPRRFVLGGAMYFDDRDPGDPVFSPDSVYPATVGNLVDASTDEGFVVTSVEKVHGECGVLVAQQPAAE